MGIKKTACRLLFQNIYTRRLHSLPNWEASLKEKIKTYPKNPQDYSTSKPCSIYRVPINMRQVEPKAYTPNIISIGPYHHGSSWHLQEMEKVKKNFLHRLVDSKILQLEDVINALGRMEEEARSHYADEVKLSKEEFVEIILLDGCFIVELLRELKRHKFTHGSSLIERWMLPVLRRDLMMLENQLPLFVLQMLFQSTNRNNYNSHESLQDLALKFFSPLIRRGNMPLLSSTQELESAKHFLDLFRLSILPRKLLGTEAETIEGEDTIDMIGSIRELKKAGMLIEKGKGLFPLDIHSEGRALVIPPLYIDDYKGTLFRNMVAFEQRHHGCKPQVSTYLVFLDKLINDVEDVEVLHKKQIIQYSSGSKKDVATLINGIGEGWIDVN
ncbi:hypothetical protein JCGZ_15235 [Jatropha curcas]|uniref:Uncharacterized protein n=1 Tax=Jatropha curcas TaxID=180498 RepID=A0A067K2S6_JATCU|nr:hypothetical protein JCGZ_15235 [Jatropha curcas]